MRKPRLYFAGKIGEVNHNWRDKFIGCSINDKDPTQMYLSPKGEYWYTGPSLVCWCGHGGSLFCHQCECTSRSEIASRCLRQIVNSDAVIGVVEPDAHGTLSEIGYARALSIPLFIVNKHDKECWFVNELATHVCCSINKAVENAVCFCRYIIGRQLCESSPLELAFFDRMTDSEYGIIFEPQVEVGPYKIDFADESRKFGIELDGFTYHRTHEHIDHDRKRQRYLQQDGWQIVRFTGNEVREDVSRCFNEAVALWKKRG